MKYFEYIIILGLFLTALVMLYYFYRRLRIQHFYRLIWKAILKKQQSSGRDKYLSSYYLLEIIKKLTFRYDPLARKALVYLSVGRFGPAQRYFEKIKQPFYMLILEAIKNPESAIKQFEKAVKKDTANQLMLIELAALYFATQKNLKGNLCLENINMKKLSNYGLAKKSYLQSSLDINDGDLLAASQNANQAIKIFHKEKAYYEEAKAYMRMGVIYRVSVVADISQIMFETAFKIFDTLACYNEMAIAYGNLGMLMASQRRFETAADYYQKAEEITQKSGQIKLKAEIKNQQALLGLMQGQNDEAEKIASAAVKIHSKLGNEEGIAFSKEILANIAWNKKELKKVMQLAFEAKNIYKELNNLSACAESMYLLALCLFEQNKSDEAEKILRDIIALAENNPCNFHTANAYNLLGLIFLKKNDLRRAKGLFQQSLDREQVNNRLGCIAADYANIGLIEFRSGNIEQAQKTLATAIEYAEVNEEIELVEILKQHLEKLKS